MEKFNNTTILTGYLKQLLHNYNLPKYKIYTREHEKYLLKNGTESPEIFNTIPNKSSTNVTLYVPYIKDNTIQEYINGRWVTVGYVNNNNNMHTHYYAPNTKIPNYTKTLKITNNIYDSYTHEYLGDFLRFHRDYYGLDLMPLYNCFSNRACDRLDLKFTVGSSKDDEWEVKFNTADQKYKIYMLPVKLFKEYTIAVESETPVELCCITYGLYQDDRVVFQDLPRLTYKKINASKFSAPLLYEGVKKLQNSSINLNELAQNEDNLKLLIKLPADNTSTIVVLEGNYIGWNDSKSDCGVARFNEAGKKPACLQNYTVLNFEYLPAQTDLPLRTPLQLLAFNTKEQHPFSDRLIEYLMENVITPIDEITKDVARAQKIIELETAAGRNAPGDYNYKYEPDLRGFWDEHIRYIIYDYMNTKVNTVKLNNGITYDILGYIDKDAEKYYHYHNKKNGQDYSILDATLEDK